MKPNGFAFTLIALAIGTHPAAGQTISFFHEFTTPAIDQATALAANESGVYVVGNRRASPGGAGIIRFDSLGNQLWTREIRVPELGNVAPSQVLVDSTGVCVHGYNPDPYPGEKRRFLRKYTAGGDELWTRFLDGPGNVAVGATGVYAVGRNASGGYVSRSNSDGVEQWTSPAGDFPQAVTVDTTGVYVLGRTGSPQYNFARKYDLGGNELWSRALSEFYFFTIAAAEPTGFYVSALELGGRGVSLRRYDSNGNEQWNRRVGEWNDAGEYGPPEVVSDATGVYVAGGNNVFTSLPGYCRSGSAADSFVRKYSADGTELWTRQFGSPDASLARGVAVNDNGVFVAGVAGEGRWDGFAYPNPNRAAYLARFEKAAAAIGGSRPRIFPGCVVNAASYVGGGVAPGEIVTVFGSAIGPVDLVPPRLTDDSRLATTLADTRILFNGVPAPLLYVSDKQSSAVVPYCVAGRSSVDVQVEYQGVRSEPETVPVLTSRPGIFSLDGSGQGQGAILNEDGTVNSPSNPARRGSVISIFATGGGEAAPGVLDGQIVGTVRPRTNSPVSVMFPLRGPSEEAGVQYAGGVPGSVAGVLQLNVRVPSGAHTGDAVSFTVVIGDQWTGSQATVALR
jgi:uncharacterized protein (TIGR03437 family)